MKTNAQTKLSGLLISLLLIFSSIYLSNCKGHVEIFGISDSVDNCSFPYVVRFFADADHRNKDLEYTWNFGDGTTVSHDIEPTHVYQKNGIYPVTLSIKQNKSFDSAEKTLYLTEDSTKAYSDWDYASYSEYLWAPARVEFQNYSRFASDFLWIFGDGDSSLLKEPVHIYETPGTYTCSLKAICEEDTSTFSIDMNVKDAPSDIYVDKVSIWLPDYGIGGDLKLEIWYDGHREYYSNWVNGVSSFPITFNVEEVLFWFSGDYDSDKLEFIVFLNDDISPEVRFEIEARDLQSDYYPTLLSFDDGYGHILESTIGYRD